MVVTRPDRAVINVPETGYVGMMLREGQVVLTATGRRTTAFPKVQSGSRRKITNTIKRVDTWLVENALAESQARGDSFNALQFSQKCERPSQADKDAAEHYLFDTETIFPAPRPFLKTFSSEESKSECPTRLTNMATTKANASP